MNILDKIEGVFNSSVWMMLFSFTALIMLWLGFIWQFQVPIALVQIYIAVLGAFATNKTVRAYKGDK